MIQAYRERRRTVSIGYCLKPLQGTGREPMTQPCQMNERPLIRPRLIEIANPRAVHLSFQLTAFVSDRSCTNW